MLPAVGAASLLLPRYSARRKFCYNARMNRDVPHFDMVDDQMAEVFRAKTPAERLAMVGAANRTARLLAAAGIRYSHPDWSDQEVDAEVARRMLHGADPAIAESNRDS